jgi:hypothetical protein
MNWKFEVSELIVKARLYVAGWLMLKVGDIMPFHTKESTRFASLMFRYARKEMTPPKTGKQILIHVCGECPHILDSTQFQSRCGHPMFKRVRRATHISIQNDPTYLGRPLENHIIPNWCPLKGAA